MKNMMIPKFHYWSPLIFMVLSLLLLSSSISYSASVSEKDGPTETIASTAKVEESSRQLSSSTTTTTMSTHEEMDSEHDDNNTDDDDDDDTDDHSDDDNEHISTKLTSDPHSITSSTSTTSTEKTTTTAKNGKTTTTEDPIFKDSPKNLISKQDLKQLTKIIKMDNDNLTKLKLISNKLNKLVESINDNRGQFSPEILIQEFIPDPIKIKDIPVEKDDWLTSYNGVFSNVTMYGIGNIEIDSIKANVNKLNAKILISIPHVYLQGHYNLDGSVSFASINGNGPFRFNITEMEIEAFGNLEYGENGQIQIEDIEIDLSPGEVNLNLENFEVLGSEVIAQTIIGALSEVIFNQVKSTVTEKVAIKIRALINPKLEKIPLNKLIRKESEILFDDIVSTVAKRIENRIDPIPLPAFERNIQTKLLQMIPINISVNVEQGKLYGLSTFQRMGDIFVTYEHGQTIIEAETGFYNLTGKYYWTLNVLGHGPSGSSSLAIKKVSSVVRLRQPLKRGAQPKLEEFSVKEIDYVWIEMKGLGIWNHLLELIINSISNVFRLEIGNLITKSVSNILQKSIDKAHFSFIP